MGAVTYRRIVTALGLILLLGLSFLDSWTMDPGHVAFFVALAALTQCFPVPLARGSLSFSFAISFPVFILYGPLMAAWVHCAGHLIGNGLARRRPVEIAFFNFSQFAISVLLAGTGARLLGGIMIPFPDLSGAVPLLVYVILYLLLNMALVYTYFILDGARLSWIEFWENHLQWSAILHLSSSALGALLAVSYMENGLLGTFLVFVPLLIVAYIFSLHLKLQLATEEMVVLYDFSRDLTGTLDMERVFSLASAAAQRLMDLDSLFLYLWDEQKQELSPVLVEGTTIEDGDSCSFGLGDGLIGTAAKELAQQMAADVHRDPGGWPCRDALPEIRSLMAVPMVVEDKLVGVLTAAKNKPGAFTPEHLRPMSILSSQMAVAIQNAVLYERTERMAVTDPVTGLYNYRFFYLKLGEELRRARRLSRPVSLLYLDIDYFKSYNDAHGHLVGDRILQELAEIIQAQVRSTDIPARYAGDEFAVILPGSPAEEAKMVAERILSQVEEHRFPDYQERRVVSVPVSVGVAAYPEDSSTETELIHAADQRMYAHKEGKRRCAGDPDRR